MKIILVRHTKVGLEPGICYGQSDVGLAETFFSEAERIAGELSAIQVEAVFTSPLSRCTKLADYLGYTKPIFDPRLMELNFGTWELLKWDDIKGEYADRWMQDYLHLPCPGGESMNDLITRITDFYQEVKRKYKKILIFTHSGPIRVFHHLFRPAEFPVEKIFDVKIDHGSVSTLTVPVNDEPK